MRGGYMKRRYTRGGSCGGVTVKSLNAEVTNVGDLYAEELEEAHVLRRRVSQAVDVYES